MGKNKEQIAFNECPLVYEFNKAFGKAADGTTVYVQCSALRCEGWMEAKKGKSGPGIQRIGTQYGNAKCPAYITKRPGT